MLVKRQLKFLGNGGYREQCGCISTWGSWVRANLEGRQVLKLPGYGRKHEGLTAYRKSKHLSWHDLVG